MKRYFEVNVNKYVRNLNFCVYRPASLDRPKNDSVMFITEKFKHKATSLYSCRNCLFFWPEGVDIPDSISKNNAVFTCENPHKEYCRFFRDNKITYLPKNDEVEYINGFFISKDAIIGKNCTILPGAYIGSEVSIGDNCYIGCGTKIVGEVQIGNNVVIRENTVLGADGLSTDRDENGKAITMPQFGNIIIEDEVQIGSNVVIARGAIDETRICKGSKIDNCTFVSHNVKIDEDSFVVGETILFGSSSVGKNCLVSGNSTIMNTVHIGNNSIVGAGSVVTKSVADNSVVKGNPAR